MPDNYVEEVNYDIETHTDMDGLDDSESGKDSNYLEMIDSTYKSGYNIGIYHGFFFGFTVGIASKVLLDKVMDYYK